MKKTIPFVLFLLLAAGALAMPGRTGRYYDRSTGLCGIWVEVNIDVDWGNHLANVVVTAEPGHTGGINHRWLGLEVSIRAHDPIKGIWVDVPAYSGPAQSWSKTYDTRSYNCFTMEVKGNDAHCNWHRGRAYVFMIGML